MTPLSYRSPNLSLIALEGMRLLVQIMSNHVKSCQNMINNHNNNNNNNKNSNNNNNNIDNNNNNNNNNNNRFIYNNKK